MVTVMPVESLPQGSRDTWIYIIDTITVECGAPQSLSTRFRRQTIQGNVM